MTASTSRLALGPALRALRRRADLSQRQLAERARVPASTIARIESGHAEDPKFRTVERLVAAAGGVLAIGSAAVDVAALPENPDDGLKDGAGRSYPAHLDVRRRWDPEPDAPLWTYLLDRNRRDRRRAERAAAERVEIVQLSSGYWIGRADDAAVVARMRVCGWDAGTVLVVVQVTDEWRELGIGRRLVAVLRAEMTRTGVTGARTVAVGSGAVRLFESCGFQRDWVRPVALTLTLADAARPPPP